MTATHFKFWFWTLIVLTITMAIGFKAADAATPTPVPTPTVTPTLKPLQPSPTSQFLYLQPTPTLLPYDPATLVSPFEFHNEITTNTAINIWRYFNHDHIIDFLNLIAIVSLTIIFVIKLLNMQTKDN